MKVTDILKGFKYEIEKEKKNVTKEKDRTSIRDRQV